MLIVCWCFCSCSRVTSFGHRQFLIWLMLVTLGRVLEAMVAALPWEHTMLWYLSPVYSPLGFLVSSLSCCCSIQFLCLYWLLPCCWWCLVGCHYSFLLPCCWYFLVGSCQSHLYWFRPRGFFPPQNRITKHRRGRCSPQHLLFLPH